MSVRRNANVSGRRASSRHPFLAESLERRTLMAAVMWTGGAGDGLWHTPGNWSGGAVPTAADDVTIAAPGSYVVRIEDPASVASLTLGTSGGAGTQRLWVRSMLVLADDSEQQNVVRETGNLVLELDGKIEGFAPLLIDGEMGWYGGTLSGTSTTTVTGTLRIGGLDDKRLEQHLINGFAGTMLWTGGGDLLLNDGQISNNGVFSISGDGMIRSIGGSVNRVSTTGPVTQSGSTIIAVPYHATSFGNTTVNGTMTLAGGGASRTTFDASGTLVFRNATYEILGVGRIQGSGTARFESGNHLLHTSDLISPRRLELLNTGTDVEIYQFGVEELALSDGAVLRAMRGPSRTTTLAIDSTSRLDLAANGLIVDYASGNSPLSQVRMLLSSGWADGSWDGPGICSSTAAADGRALGYAEAADLFSTFPATFLGWPVDDTAVLIRSTLYGDANLDGTVALNDFNRLAGSFGHNNTFWSQGDFNYDASTNLRDFNRLAANFGQSVAPDSAAGGAGDAMSSPARVSVWTDRSPDEEFTSGRHIEQLD